MHRRVPLLKFSLSLFLFASTPFALADLEISDAWIREAPPTANNLAGYAKVVNNGNENVKIIATSSPQFARVEMHTTIITGGMMRMQKQKELIISPNQSVEFEPGGQHIMLVGPHRRLIAGDNVDVVFKLGSGRTLTATFNVVK